MLVKPALVAFAIASSICQNIMFAAFDVDQSLLDFVKTVDLPKVHPGETIQDIMDCRTNNGIDEN